MMARRLRRKTEKQSMRERGSQATPSPPNPKSASKGDDAPKTITCYHCGEPGHKKPDCPKLKSSAAAAAPPKRVGALTMGTRARAGPYLACDVSAPEDVRGAAVPRVRAKGKPDGVRGTEESWVQPDVRSGCKRIWTQERSSTEWVRTLWLTWSCMEAW